MVPENGSAVREMKYPDSYKTIGEACLDKWHCIIAALSKLLRGPRGTMDSILALHPGLNLGRDIFSLLLSLWTGLRSNPSSAKSKGFCKGNAANA